jgi:single-stranded-DNA-specific exonuclease
LAEDSVRAEALARELDTLNRERRGIEAQMQDTALAHLQDLDPGDAWGVSLYDPTWHQGVIGILAARMRERFHRPVIAFAPGKDGELKGSGRSVPNLHLRDALDLVDKHYPGLLVRFGGHAAAAGLSIRATDFARFREAFDAILRTLLTLNDLEQRIETDGELGANEATLPLAEQMSETVWGQGFPPPRFRGHFRVEEQRLVGGKHRKLRLSMLAPQTSRTQLEAMVFGEDAPLADLIDAVYRLDVNEWNGNRGLQLILEHWEPSPSPTAPVEASDIRRVSALR